MTERPPSAVGTVAQEVARLLEDLAKAGGPGAGSSEGLNPYPGGSAEEPAPPDAPKGAPWAEGDEGAEAADEPLPGACSECGRERDNATQTPITCRLCPLCRGIALLRAVRPETVDLLADLALALAASLRDAATRSRASDPASSARPASGRPPEGDRATVQDIPVDDESEG